MRFARYRTGRWDGLADRLLNVGFLGVLPIGLYLMWVVRHAYDPVVRWFPLVMIAVALGYGAEQVYPGWHGLSDYERDGNGPAIIDGDQSE